MVTIKRNNDNAQKKIEASPLSPPSTPRKARRIYYSKPYKIKNVVSYDDEALYTDLNTNRLFPVKKPLLKVTPTPSRQYKKDSLNKKLNFAEYQAGYMSCSLTPLFKSWLEFNTTLSCFDAFITSQFAELIADDVYPYDVTNVFMSMTNVFGGNALVLTTINYALAMFPLYRFEQRKEYFDCLLNFMEELEGLEIAEFQSGLSQTGDVLQVLLRLVSPQFVQSMFATGVAASNVTNAVNAISDLADKGFDPASVKDAFEGMTADLASTSVELSSVTHKFSLTIISAAAVCTALTLAHSGRNNKVAAFLGLVGSSGLLYCSNDAVKDKVLSLIGRFTSEVAEPESGWQQTIGPILIGCLFPTVSFKSLPLKLFDSVSRLDKFNNNLTSLIEALMSTVTSVSSYVRVEILGYVEEEKFMVGSDALNKQLQETSLFISKFADGDMTMSSSNLKKCLNLMHINRNNFDTFRTSPSGIISCINSQYNDLKRIQQVLAPICSHEKITRIEPLMVLLAGAPGVGKTTVTEFLSATVTSRILEGEDLTSFKSNPEDWIYNRIPTKFWEGYNPSTVCLRMDDVNQFVEVPGAEESESMEIIRVINTAPYCLNTAFSDKGTKYAKPKFVLASCNDPNLQSEAVRVAGALNRRVKYTYAVYPIDSLADDLDKTYHLRAFKEPLTAEQYSHIYDFLMFKQIKVVNGIVRHEEELPLTYDQLVDKLVAELKYRDKFQEAKVTNLREKMFPKPNSFEKHFNKPAQVANAWLNTADVFIQECMDIYDRMYSITPSAPNYAEFMLGNLDKYADFFDEVLLGKDSESYTSFVEAFITEPLNLPKARPTVVENVKFNIQAAKDKIYKICQYFRIEEVLQYIKTLPILKIGVPVLSAVLGYLLYKKGAKDGEEYVLGAPLTQSRQFTTRGLRHSRKFEPALPQGSFANDQACRDILRKIMLTNMVEILVRPPETTASDSLGFGVFMKGSFLLLPYHFIEQINSFMHNADFGDGKIILRFHTSVAGSNDEFMYIKDFISSYKLVSGADDLCIVNVDSKYMNFASRPNVLKYVGTLRDHESNKAVGARLVHNANGEFCHNVMTIRRVLGAVPVRSHDGSSIRSFTRCYTYSANTAIGDCGALLGIMNASMKAKIFGMHIAGRPDGSGFSTMLVQERIQETIDQFAVIHIESEMDDIAIEQCGQIVSDGHIAHVGNIPKAVPSMSHTVLYRSPFYGVFSPSLTVPARLRSYMKNGVLINPYEKALTKYCIRHDIIPDEHAELTCATLFDVIRVNSRSPASKQIFTIDEAIIGVPELGLKGIPRGTSPGYPYVLSRVAGLKGRYRFTGKDTEYNLDNEHMDLLRVELNDAIDKAKHGKRTNWMILDNLKDEDLPIDKVAEGKARIFCAVPFPKLVLDRMYFGAFVNWLTENRVDNGLTIGVNPYSTEWHDIATHLNVFGPSNCGAGDFSGFDGSQRGQIHKKILKYINEWYSDGPDNARIREVLFADVYNSYHIRDDKVYEWMGGMTSGFFMTAALNSLYNLFAFQYVYGKMCDFNVNDMLNVRDHLRVIVMGDDNIFSVSERIKHNFTESNLKVAFGEIGLAFTNEMKSEDLNEELRPITAIGFCKRSFVFDKRVGHTVAPLDLAAIYASMDYFKKGQLRADHVSHIDWMLMELAIYPEAIYDTHVEVIRKVCERYDYSPTTYNYSMLRAKLKHVVFAM